MYERLSNTQIEFLECFYDSTAMTECLIPENIQAPHLWDENCECVEIRPYQFAMQNYSYMYANDFKLSTKENFRIKKGAANLSNIAARNIGKSFFTIIDVFLTTLHNGGKESCIGAANATYLKKIISPIFNMLRTHPFFEIFRKKGKNSGIKENPIEASTLHGHVFYGRNEKVDTPDPGTQFHGLHYETLWYEEASYMSQKGKEKRVDSGTSYGHIERLNGIPDLRIGSPLGDILRNDNHKQFICRLPQYVREDWDEQTRNEQAEKYGGKESMAYKLNVEGEIMEGAFGKWDMERIRKQCIQSDTKIKFFELGKKDFKDFYNKLVIDRLPAEQIIIASDIGTTGSPSEITIFFGNNDHWKYHYQISLFKLTIKEQAKVFKWIFDKLGSAYISLDCTNADGRGIRDELLHLGVLEEYLCDFRMNKNLVVDFEKDEKGFIKRGKNGQPLYREEYTKEFAIQLLEKYLYNGMVDIPYHEKFLKEFAGYIEKVTASGRKIYGSSTTDHLIDSFLLFVLCAWDKNKKNLKNQKRKKRCLGYI